MDRINLILIKNNEYYDISSLVESIKWSGRKGSSGRTITVGVIDDDGYNHARIGLDVEDGHQCIFSYDNVELFRGICLKQSQSESKKLSFTAYDNGVYLANNRDTFVYENKTASEIFKDCCKRYSIPIGDVAGTSYVISELVKPNTTAFDCVLDALSQDFDNTRVRHYISSAKGVLSLLTRQENIVQWVIETGQNLVSYNYNKSVEKTKTRFKIYSNENTVVAEDINSELEMKIGVFQEVQKISDSKSGVSADALIKAMAKEKGSPDISLIVESLGNAEVFSGLGVFIIIKELSLNRTFYVDEDTHVFTDQYHKMNLKLTLSNDLDVLTEESTSDFKVGDIVDFKGGHHYVSSNSTNPVGAKCKAGKAKITLVAKGAKKPYHLIHTDSSSSVYGWVEDGTFTK